METPNTANPELAKLYQEIEELRSERDQYEREVKRLLASPEQLVALRKACADAADAVIRAWLTERSAEHWEAGRFIPQGTKMVYRFLLDPVQKAILSVPLETK